MIDQGRRVLYGGVDEGASAMPKRNVVEGEGIGRRWPV
jgi:hypothetical protein